MINVLLIEDNPQDAELIKQQLSEYVNLTVVDRLENAHDVGETHVILLDLMLPGSVGVETVRICRGGFPHLPIVVLTHVDSSDIQAQCVAAGANYYFRKGEQSIATILRAMEAAITAFTMSKASAEELVYAQRYIEKANTLVKSIQKRVDDIIIGLPES